VLKGHTAPVNSVIFSPDGKQLASASADRTIRLWDVASGEEMNVLRGHDDAVNSVAFSSNGGQLVSASADQTIKLWDVNNGNELIKFLTVTDLGEPREIRRVKRKLKGFVTNNHGTVSRSVVQPDFVGLHAFLLQLGFAVQNF
jgi:WD40 repeat protein